MNTRLFYSSVFRDWMDLGCIQYFGGGSIILFYKIESHYIDQVNLELVL